MTGRCGPASSTSGSVWWGSTSSRADERRAILETDFHTLYQMGVHSLLLGPLAATLGMSFPDYLAILRGTKP